MIGELVSWTMSEDTDQESVSLPLDPAPDEVPETEVGAERPELNVTVPSDFDRRESFLSSIGTFGQDESLRSPEQRSPRVQFKETKASYQNPSSFQI